MNRLNIDKKALVNLIINMLSKELEQAISAANQAHAAAVDDESVAETQYDTLAIEASYLAEGQSKRVQELQAAIRHYQTLNVAKMHEKSRVSLTALVQLASQQSKQHWFFIGPAAGGFVCQQGGQQITVITAQSPIGKALIEKHQGDDIEVILANKKLDDYIVTVI